MRVLVAYASADGSTKEIAERIASKVHEFGPDVAIGPAGELTDIDGFDAVIVGSAIHGRQWLDEAAEFMDRHRVKLSQRPFWTFSVGMPGSLPRFLRKIAQTEETAIVAQLGELRPRDHRLFSGIARPAQFPLASRVFFRMIGGHYGDFRDWRAIDDWAAEIASDLRQARVGP